MKPLTTLFNALPFLLLFMVNVLILTSLAMERNKPKPFYSPGKMFVPAPPVSAKDEGASSHAEGHAEGHAASPKIVHVTNVRLSTDSPDITKPSLKNGAHDQGPKEGKVEGEKASPPRKHHVGYLVPAHSRNVQLPDHLLRSSGSHGHSDDRHQGQHSPKSKESPDDGFAS